MSRLHRDGKPVNVTCDSQTLPCAVHWRGQRRAVTVLNHWRVDTGWWDVPIRRDYYKTHTDDGNTLLLVYDSITAAWFVRRVYG